MDRVWCEMFILSAIMYTNGLNGEAVQETTITTYPMTNALGSTSSASGNPSTDSTYRISPDELTQTYFQYNQFCGDSCVLKDYHVAHDSCCQNCSCELDTCNNNIAQSTCCPDLMNKLKTFPNYFQKCIHPLLFAWKPWLPLPNATLMVASCPHGLTGSVVDKCENIDKYSDIEYKMPYSVIDKSTNIATTYRNKHCAACWRNFDNENETTRWRLTAICSEHKLKIEVFDIDSLTSAVENTDDCTLVFTPSFKLHLTETCGQGVAECNITKKWFKHDTTTDTVCQAFRAPFRNVYRNLFCYICNTNDELTSDSFLNCEKDQKVNETFVMIASPKVPKETDKHQIQDRLDKSRCRKDEVLDRVQDKCLPIQCRFYKVFGTNTDRCEPLVDMIGGIELVVLMKLIPMRRNCLIVNLPGVESIQAYVSEMLRVFHMSDISSIQVKYFTGNNSMCGLKSLTELVLNDVDYFTTEIKLHLPVEEDYLNLRKPVAIEALITFNHLGEIAIQTEDSNVMNFTVIVDGNIASQVRNIIKENDVTNDEIVGEENGVTGENNASKEDDVHNEDEVPNDDSISDVLKDDDTYTVRTLHVTDTCPVVGLESSFYNVSHDVYGISVDSFRLHTFEFLHDIETNQIFICRDMFESLQSHYIPIHSGQQTTPDVNSKTIDATSYGGTSLAAHVFPVHVFVFTSVLIVCIQISHFETV